MRLRVSKGMKPREKKADKVNERINMLLDDLDSGDIPNHSDMSVEEAENELAWLKRILKRKFR